MGAWQGTVDVNKEGGKRKRRLNPKENKSTCLTWFIPSFFFFLLRDDFVYGKSVKKKDLWNTPKNTI